MTGFSAEVFLTDKPSRLRQGDWKSNADFLAVLRASWQQQYADYLGEDAARSHVAELERQGQLFTHHEPLTLHAWVDERIVGICALQPLDGIDLITMLEVHPVFRGRGIGSQLLDAVGTGRERLMAHVSIHQPRALALYRRHGFHVLERDKVRHGQHLLEFDVVAKQARN